MEEAVMRLSDAKMNTEFPEITLILIWEYWLRFTDIDEDALSHLVEHSSKILLPNVKHLTDEKKKILKFYKGHINIGVMDI